jgi:hypothetical protein
MAEDKDKLSKIEEISKVSGSKGVKPVEEVVERIAPDKAQFDNLMQQDIAQMPQQAGKNSLMDEVRDLHRKVQDFSKASPDTIFKQTNDVIAQIEDVKTKLATPNLEFKGSVSTLLQNKLSHIDESLKVALNRTGSEYANAKVPETASKNPVERFLDFLTHGQHQLQKVAEDVRQMHLNKTELSPANMMAIQLKVGYVQQEIEFFTALLNKALESTKTIMNVQV